MNRGPVLVAAGIAVGLALAAVVTTCTGPDTSRIVDADTPLAEQCGDAPREARRLVVEARDGHSLGAAVVTSTESADGPLVVLRHGASQTLCDWLDWAEATAEQTGAAVLLMDRRGAGSSPGRRDLSHEPTDATALLAAARAELGVKRAGRKVVLVGSSMGNATTLSLPAEMDERTCAVVAVSPVPGSGPLDGIASFQALPHDLSPDSVHVTWAEDDNNVPENAVRLADAAHALGSAVTEHEVKGNAHSITMLTEHDDVVTFVEDAITSCA